MEGLTLSAMRIILALVVVILGYCAGTFFRCGQYGEGAMFILVGVLCCGAIAVTELVEEE